MDSTVLRAVALSLAHEVNVVDVRLDAGWKAKRFHAPELGTHLLSEASPLLNVNVPAAERAFSLLRFARFQSAGYGALLRQSSPVTRSPAAFWRNEPYSEAPHTPSHCQMQAHARTSSDQRFGYSRADEPASPRDEICHDVRGGVLRERQAALKRDGNKRITCDMLSLKGPPAELTRAMADKTH